MPSLDTIALRRRYVPRRYAEMSHDVTPLRHDTPRRFSADILRLRCRHFAILLLFFALMLLPLMLPMSLVTPLTLRYVAADADFHCYAITLMLPFRYAPPSAAPLRLLRY